MRSSFFSVLNFGLTLGGFGSMSTVAVLLLVAWRYSSSVRMTYMCPNFPPVFSLSIAAAMLHSSNFSCLMLWMVGSWSTRVMLKVSSVALMAEAICAAALVYDTILYRRDLV